MARQDLVAERRRLTEEQHVDDTGVRVRTRIDLYVNLPEAFSSKLPGKLQRGLSRAFQDAASTRALAALGITVPEPSNTSQEDLAGERAVIPGLEALELSWTRNPPAAADEFEITLRGDALPVDLRLFESIQVFGWLFVHEDPSEDLQVRKERLKPGDPGCFGGVVDKIGRDDADGTITLECRDFTAILGRDARPSVIDGLNLDQAIEGIVRDLVDSVPGGNNWEISTRGELGDRDTLSGMFSEEKKVRVKESKRRKRIRVARSAAHDSVKMTKKLLAVPVTRRFVEIIDGEVIRRAKPRSGPDAVEVAKILKSHAGRRRRRLLGKWVTRLVPPTPDRIFGTKRMTVWDAITRATQLAGAVAEVGISHTGRPMVVLVDGLEIQEGRVFRAFERGGRKHRVVTHGADLAQLVEGRDLVAAKKVNWVEVYSTDAITGTTLREVFRDGEFVETKERGRIKRQLADVGLTVFAHGVNNSEGLKRIARTVWAQVNRGELEASWSTLLPWTTGGGIFDPDLLACAPGALMEVQFARADRYRGLELEDVLKAIGIPAPAARKLTVASERLKPSLLFQVGELTHTVGADGEYRADLLVQTLLSDIRLPKGSTLEAV